MRVPGAALIMNVVVLTAVLSCLNSALYITSRVLFVLSSRGDAPAWLVQVDARKVPTRAIITSSLFGYLAMAASILSPQVIFSFLVNASGATMLFIYLMLCAAELRQRPEYERTEPSRLTVRMWLFPWSTYGVIVAILAVLAAMAATADLASQLYSSLLVALLVWGAYLLRRMRATKLPAAG
jgi:L-asparagine transporter-like permease